MVQIAIATERGGVIRVRVGLDIESQRVGRSAAVCGRQAVLEEAIGVGGLDGRRIAAQVAGRGDQRADLWPFVNVGAVIGIVDDSIFARL